MQRIDPGASASPDPLLRHHARFTLHTFNYFPPSHPTHGIYVAFTKIFPLFWHSSLVIYLFNNLYIYILMPIFGDFANVVYSLQKFCNRPTVSINIRCIFHRYKWRDLEDYNKIKSLKKTEIFIYHTLFLFKHFYYIVYSSIVIICIFIIICLLLFKSGLSLPKLSARCCDLLSCV